MVSRSNYAVVIAALSLSGLRLSAQALAPNLVYTSLEPCRLFDTRSASAGKLIHSAPRTFNIVGVDVTSTTFTGQGGTDGGCSVPGFDGSGVPQVQAVLLNLVAVAATGPGDLLAWPSDHPAPLSSALNYAAASALSGLNIANAVIVPLRQDSQGGDISLEAQVSDTHLVGDVLGYFSAGAALKGTNAGSANTFLGAGAGFAAGKGFEDVAIGAGALAPSPNPAGFNVAVGYHALNLTTGDGNVAVGSRAMETLTTGTNNIALGLVAGASFASNEQENIIIGNEGEPGDSNIIRLGNIEVQTATFIAGIMNTTVSGAEVFISHEGQLGVATSSLRFKEDVEDMAEASDDLMRLRPVLFHYKPSVDDGSHRLQYGLIAEEVAAIYPGLVQYGDDGAPLTVRYPFVNAMLLNEAQKQHRLVIAQQATIAAQGAEIHLQRQRADEQEARIRRLEELVRAGSGPTPR
jgi:hypothetical protein